MSDIPSALAFSYRKMKRETIEVFHHGRLASTLRGDDAVRFLAKIERITTDESQRLMARVTGNYKRGNERNASRHPRNAR